MPVSLPISSSVRRRTTYCWWSHSLSRDPRGRWVRRAMPYSSASAARAFRLMPVSHSIVRKGMSCWTLPGSAARGSMFSAIACSSFRPAGLAHDTAPQRSAKAAVTASAHRRSGHLCQALKACRQTWSPTAAAPVADQKGSAHTTDQEHDQQRQVQRHGDDRDQYQRQPSTRREPVPPAHPGPPTRPVRRARRLSSTHGNQPGPATRGTRRGLLRTAHGQDHEPDGARQQAACVPPADSPSRSGRVRGGAHGGAVGQVTTSAVGVPGLVVLSVEL